MSKRRERFLALTLITAALTVGGCQAASNPADVVRSVAPTGQPQAIRYDGTYRQTVNYSTVKPCPDDDVPPTGVQVSEIVFDDGSLRMWNWPEGHEDQRETGWNGTYTFFKDQLRVEDPLGPLTMDFTYDGTTLTLSNMRGGTCGDARAWATKPWIRQ